MSTSLDEHLANLARAPSAEDWRPQRFELAREHDREAIARLLQDGVVRAVHDTLRQQIAGLMETRHPAQRLARSEVETLVDEHLGSSEPARYGVWFFYPWSGRLVHLLPEDEFRELRTSRNRNKITAEEQAALRRLRVGVIGLSVGQSSAMTIVLEEVCGVLKLADFDQLELSNLNRLRAGVHQLGVNKAVLAAREATEINPYLQVELFPEGITESNLDAFLTDGGRLDLLVEECDGFDIKVLARERARALRIPVIMETTDRGLLDVERFDREPTRALFHGLAGDVRADALRGLSMEQKLPFALRIVGFDHVSRRMAASLFDIETTIKTWPQLASEVALGGALTTNALRRIALGQLAESGRYYVDIEELVADGKSAAGAPQHSLDIEVSPDARSVELPSLARVVGPLSREHVRALVAWGVTAPSGGNCQPWRFVSSGQRLRCIHDIDRSRSFLDYRNTGSYLAFGAFVENVALAARVMGLAAEVQIFPEPEQPKIVCDIHFRSAATDIDPLVWHVAARCTNRRLGKRERLTRGELRQLTDIASAAGARLQWLEDERDLTAMGDVLGEGDRQRFLSELQHREMMAEVRWSREEVERTRDGLDVATLELSSADLAAMRLISKGAIMKLVGALHVGSGLRRPTQKAIAAASAVGLLSRRGASAQAFFEGGRALQRVWLAATGLELSLQPMTALSYIFQRLDEADGLTSAEQRDYGELRAAFRRLFEVPAATAELMVFRVAKAGPPSARALRRRVDDVLKFE